MEILESGLLKEGWSRVSRCEHCQCVVRVGLPDLYQTGISTSYASWDCPECGWGVDFSPIHYDFIEKLPTHEQFIEQKANNKQEVGHENTMLYLP